MSKTALALFIIFCLHSAVILQNSRILVNAGSSLLIVGEGGYDSIQEAVNNASSGDVIFVHKGVYRENIIINKAVTLIGEDRENTIIDGNSKGNVISINASYVNISGFTIKNSEPITGYGIIIDHSEKVIIHNNIIKGNGIGIQLTYSSENQVYNNTVSTNRIGLHLFCSAKNAIYRNVITINTDGIFIYYSTDNSFYENTIYSNYFGVFVFHYGDNNVFYHNNFVNNVNNVYAEQATNNLWSYKGEGNYWNDYRGNDMDGDGIGDVPYKITDKNDDDYPLMGRFCAFAVSYKGGVHYVATTSNATILNFTFKTTAELGSNMLLFDVGTVNGSAGFIRMTIPKELMDNVHMVLIDDEKVNVNFLNATEGKNIYLYFTFFGNCSVKIVYSEILELYYQLLNDYSELLDKFYDLNESYFKLLALNASNSMLIEEINILNEALYDQTENFKGLTYVFSASVAIFIVTTIYLSKKAHEKRGQVTKS